MKKIPGGSFTYSDKDRTIRYKDENGNEVIDIAPDGKLFRFYAHDQDNIFYYEVNGHV